jgi:prepilin-type N-terminal cleavage/methylation domain-containing protein
MWMQRRQARNKSKGFTLVELSLTVGAVAIIALGGYQIYKTVTADTNTKRQMDGITDFINASKQTYAIQGSNWGAFTPANMIAMNRIPPQFSRDTTRIYDAFSNEVLFATPVANEGVVRFTMRSPEECAKIAQAVADLSYSAAVGANGSETTIKTGTTPLSISDLATGCAVPSPVLRVAIR